MKVLPYFITKFHSGLQPSSLLGAGTSDLSVNISVTQTLPSKSHQASVSQTPAVTHSLLNIPVCLTLMPGLVLCK